MIQEETVAITFPLSLIQGLRVGYSHKPGNLSLRFDWVGVGMTLATSVELTMLDPCKSYLKKDRLGLRVLSEQEGNPNLAVLSVYHSIPRAYCSVWHTDAQFSFAEQVNSLYVLSKANSTVKTNHNHYNCSQGKIILKLASILLSFSSLVLRLFFFFFFFKCQPV